MPTRLPRSLPLVDFPWKDYRPAQPEFDLVVIGGGSAGYAAARTGAALGARVAVIEAAREVGGLCILRGCMPSKALLESAHRWHAIGHAREFGLVAKAVEVDMKCIQARKQHLISNFAAYRRRQLNRGKFTFLRGHAAFLDAHTLLLQRGTGRELVTASAFILATGSSIQRVPVPGLWATDCLTSDTALELSELPERIAVLGGGVVAVELGQFFSRVGVETTLLQRSRHLVKHYDKDVSAELVRAFQAEGLKVQTGVEILEVKKTSKGKKISYRQGRRLHELVVDEILCAMGRIPAVEKLGLEKAGVQVNEGRLKVEPTMATNIPHIFAAGDVVGQHEVVHIAIQQGEIAVRNALRQIRGSKEAPEKIDYRLKCLVTFTEPELAQVGLSETEAQEKKIDYLSAKAFFRDHGKAMIGGYNFGFIKILAEKTRGEIIGAQIIGPHAAEMIHELIAVMRYRGTVKELAEMPHYHPTLSELITEPAEEILAKLQPS